MNYKITYTADITCTTVNRSLIKILGERYVKFLENNFESLFGNGPNIKSNIPDYILTIDLTK